MATSLYTFSIVLSKKSSIARERTEGRVEDHCLRGRTRNVEKSPGGPRSRDGALAPLFVMLEPRRSLFISSRGNRRGQRTGYRRVVLASRSCLARENVQSRKKISRTFRGTGTRSGVCRKRDFPSFAVACDRSKSSAPRAILLLLWLLLLLLM